MNRTATALFYAMWAFASLPAVASETTAMSDGVTCQGHCPQLCQSDNDYVGVYGCVDQAINKDFAAAVQPSPACDKSAPHNPAATARCVQGSCQLVIPR